MSYSLPLRDASAQDIQLELLRRAKWNALDGERVAASLLAHRDLWLAIMLDRQGVPNYSHPTQLMAASLIKLRDLPDNFWNADTLFILTETHEKARQIAKVADDEEWAGEVVVFEDQEEIDAALGTGRDEFGLLYVWWD